MTSYNVWNKWGKLKTVVLGTTYSYEFFRDITDNKVRSDLQKIADETAEDLLVFEKVLKDFGCKVLRPYLDSTDSIMNYVNLSGAIQGRVPRAPLMPRDEQVVLGNKLYFTGKDHKAIMQLLKEYNSEDVGFLTGKGKNHKTAEGPNLLLIGSDLYVDVKDWKLTKQNIETLKQDIPNLRIHRLNIGGHNDGLFHTLKHKVIFTTTNIQNYTDTFPGWDVHYVDQDTYEDNLLIDFKKTRASIKQGWWYPGQHNNSNIGSFIDNWLNDWVGFIQESVFDLNCLMLDEHHACMINYSQSTNEFLKKHKIEPIRIPFRHKYFWDGGLHCLTLELEREGTQEDYFPNRTQELVDPGYERLYFRKWKEEQVFLEKWKVANGHL